MKQLSNGGRTMSRLIAMVAMAVVVSIGLQWVGQEVIQHLLAEAGASVLTGSVTGIAAFAIMGLLATVVCFKS